MIALKMFIYSLFMAVLLYLTVILLPDTLNINENVSRGLFTLILSMVFILAKDKWWIKIVSLILGLVAFLLLIVLLTS